MPFANVSPDEIPFLDLITPHAELESELVAAFCSSLRSGKFVGGPQIEKFEAEFARFCGSRDAIAVGSGTDALRFAILASGVKPGDAIITVPNTFIATSEAISQAGALPEFVDIDQATYNMSVSALAEYLENRCYINAAGELLSCRSQRPVTAIIPVHLYGQMADMDPILDLAERYRLTVIEDACQAHGAEYYSTRHGRWMKAGTMGRAAAFSFYPGKNLGACGEGGAITTNDPELARRARMLRDHGQSRKYYHEIEGYNGRMDAVQAGFLQVKLGHLAEWNRRRRERAADYNRLFAGYEDLVPAFEPQWSRAIYHLYVVRTQNRKGLIAHLTKAGIGTGIHYPIPLHLQEAYASLGYRQGDFPATESAASRILSLPMFPQLTAPQLHRVAHEVLAFCQASVALR